MVKSKFDFHTCSFTVCCLSSSSIGDGEEKSCLSWSVSMGEIACNDADMTLPRNIK